MRKYQPRDATTNPSLLLKAATMPEYAAVVDRVVSEARQGGATPAAALSAAMDRLAVAFGIEILKIVPKRLDSGVASAANLERVVMDERTFRWMHNEDAMATEKLSEGIRLFAADAIKLEKFLLTRLAS